MRMITAVFFCTLLQAPLAFSTEISIGAFAKGDVSGWQEKIYKGKTTYGIVKENGGGVLKAHSNKGASGLMKEVKVDPKKYPILHWSWKIEHTLKKEDIRKKSGDDFAARVYVIFPRTLFWRMRAINYVWAAKMVKEEVAPSPYTGNSQIIAVESGDEKAGQWLVEERNVYEDYRRIFGEEPPAVGAVALMTDTDDTQEEVTAWYGDILFSRPPVKEK